MAIQEYICDTIKYKIYEIDEIPSTNTYLKQNYFRYGEYSVLYALKQTAGRGRYNRKWISEEDLCFSILFKHKLSNAIIAPLAIVLSLKKYQIFTQIKWPNDIYLNGKKLAGILIEDIYKGKYMASVVGIGLNISAKPKVDGIGLPKKIDREELMKEILANYANLIVLPMDKLIELYKKYNMLLNQKIWYKNEMYLVCGIDEQGHLILENDSGIITVETDEIDIKMSILRRE